MKSIRRQMEVCQHCGALESAHTTATKRDAYGNVVRYRICVKCRKKMPPLVLMRHPQP